MRGAELRPAEYTGHGTAEAVSAGVPGGSYGEPGKDSQDSVFAVHGGLHLVHCPLFEIRQAHEQLCFTGRMDGYAGYTGYAFVFRD